MKTYNRIDRTTSCTPFMRVVGEFSSHKAWGKQKFFGEWSVEILDNKFSVSRNGNVSADGISINDESHTEWIWISDSHSGQALVLRYPNPNQVGYSVELLYAPQHMNMAYRSQLLTWDTLSHHNLDLTASQNGDAFFIFAWESHRVSKNHYVFRTSDGSPLCSWGFIDQEDWERFAEITNDNKVRICTRWNGNIVVYSEELLPMGKCEVFPPIIEFNETLIIDGPEGEKKPILQFSVINTGTDCLEIKKIISGRSFNIINATDFPHYIRKGKKWSYDLEFNPYAIDINYSMEKRVVNEELQIELTEAADPQSATSIKCEGYARMSHARCEIIGENQILPVVFGINDTKDGSYSIKNAGEDTLRVDAITMNNLFNVISPELPVSLGPLKSHLVKVKFAPTSDTLSPQLIEELTDKPTLVEESLYVQCTPQRGANEIRCKGTVRLPHMELSVLPPPPLTTHCYRRNLVTIEVENKSEVELRISVSSPDSSALYEYPILESHPSSVAPNKIYSLTLIVWSDHPGPFSIPLIITGSVHLSALNKDYSTTCYINVVGTNIPMQPDVYEQNNDFHTASLIDLPRPEWVDIKTFPGAQLFSQSLTSLSLHDCEGNDNDYFAIFFYPRVGDSQTHVSKLSLGLELVTTAPCLQIKLQTRPEKTAHGKPFSLLLQLYQSDAYEQKIIGDFENMAFFNDAISIFRDYHLYAKVSNPQIRLQGPVEYDIIVTYTTSSTCIRCSKGLTLVQYRLLEDYYDAIWLVDPPHDVDGTPVTKANWIKGAAITINDVPEFIAAYRAYVFRPDVLEVLQSVLHISADAIVDHDTVAMDQ